MKRLSKKNVCALVAAVLLVSGLAVDQAAAAGVDTGIPILTYHDLTRDPSQTDSMTITEERFRLDMEFLSEFGYTPLLTDDLIAIQQGDAAMPEKPVMITFDDGYLSNYTLAYPILQQTGMKAIISVVAYNMGGTGGFSVRQNGQTGENESGSHLTWEQMREMVASGLVEIGSHTYNLHNPELGGVGTPNGVNGVMRKTGESFPQYNARVGGDLQRCIDLIIEHTGQQRVNYFAYPFGAYDSWMDRILDEQGVPVSVWSNNAKPASVADGLRNLTRYGIKMDQSVSELLRQTDTATPTRALVSVNGIRTNLLAYNIDGSNYVRVRDVAMMLKDTVRGFDVQWNSASGRVELRSMTAYEPIGTEDAPLAPGSCTVQSYTEPTVADGAAHMIASYQMEGSTYYKLRSLGELCGFGVEWNEADRVIEVTA
nr:polysaccharide deacetylase family protein [uncultured Agathobaculum sp.]